VDASYQVSVHLAKRFQRRFIEIDQPEQELPMADMHVNGLGRSLNRGPSIDASYQVSVHLATLFQRRRLKCETLTEDGGLVMAKAHMAFLPGELKINLK